VGAAGRRADRRPLIAERPWVDALKSVVIGGGMLLWARPWSPDRHAAWVVRVEPDLRQRFEPRP
jgi:hypothetical protein